MSRTTWILSLTAALAALAAPTDADACVPPHHLLAIEAVGPADGASDISPDAQVVVQLRPEQDYDSTGKFGASPDAPIVLTLTDEATGESHTVTATLGDHWDARTAVVFDAELAPSTAYHAALGPDGDIVHHAWNFSTGEGALPELDTDQQLNIDVSGTYTMRAEWSCCPEEFVGQCPTCWKIGENPDPTLAVTFDLLQHPLGVAAFTYTIQTRKSDQPSWNDGQSVAFGDGSEGTLARSSIGVVDTFCVRVVADSVVDDVTVVSEEHCAPGSERFGEAPDPVRFDTEGVAACGELDPDDEDGDDDEVEDTDEEEQQQDEEEHEQPGADEQDDRSAGKAPAVACSHSGATGASSALLLFALGLLRRRRRTRSLRV